jgi:hypothetical protein
MCPLVGRPRPACSIARRLPTSENQSMLHCLPCDARKVQRLKPEPSRQMVQPFLKGQQSDAHNEGLGRLEGPIRKARGGRSCCNSTSCSSPGIWLHFLVFMVIQHSNGECSCPHNIDKRFHRWYRTRSRHGQEDPTGNIGNFTQSRRRLLLHSSARPFCWARWRKCQCSA